MSLLSVIVPCYNEEESIPLFYDAMKTVMEQFATEYPDVSFEYIFVDDGSKDGTVDVIRKLRSEDDRIHYVSFSRNFGKESALCAGLSKAKCDCVVCMDVDLQDPPHLLAEMYGAIVN